MKKLVLLLIIGVLITASCSNDSEADLTAEIVDNMKQMQDLINSQARGTYDMVWIVDKSVVDTATFSTEIDPQNCIISHFPIDFLDFQVMGRIADDSYFKFTYDYQSTWVMYLSYVGYSTSNAYLSNAIWNPRTFYKLNGDDHICQVWINSEQFAGNQTMLIYDTEKDVWSGSVPLDSFKLTRVKDQLSYTWRKHPYPLNLSFQTTGKKKK